MTTLLDAAMRIYPPHTPLPNRPVRVYYYISLRGHPDIMIPDDAPGNDVRVRWWLWWQKLGLEIPSAKTGRCGILQKCIDWRRQQALEDTASQLNRAWAGYRTSEIVKTKGWNEQ